MNLTPHTPGALLAAALLSAPLLAAPTNEGEKAPAAPEVEPPPLTQEERMAQLESKVDILTDEIERLRLGDAFVPIGDRFSGLGPAASKVYTVDSGLSIGGYGEVVASDVAGTGDSADFLRAILYFGYRFDENWVLNTEIEIEHADEIFLEFATLDYLYEECLSFRAGLLLLPMGFLNELHEPTTFPSVRRPDVESFIIPSTWRENGAGIFGESDGFEYRAYVVNGFNGDEFQASNGLRSGRQKGSQAEADDIAVVGRLDYRGSESCLVGASAYYGDSGQENGFHGTVSILEAHGEYRTGGLRVRGLGAVANVDDVDMLNLTGFVPASPFESIGEKLTGGYVEVGYDLHALEDRDSSLTPFVRYEMYDLQRDIPNGFQRDGSRNVDLVTFGVAWSPITNLVFKLDYQDYDTEGGPVADRLNVGAGYVF